MVREDDAGALELHIRVNEQNLLAVPEKCNIGTLRLPSDPSWPKIPLRRSTGNIDDVIKPPCVVTVTGTSRRNCNAAQTCQYPKSRINNRYEISTHVPERLPGCVDPRFKRQIPRQYQAEKSDEFCNANQTQMRENDGMKCEKAAGNIHTMFASTNSKTCASKKSENGKGLLNITQQHSISHCNNGCVCNWMRDKENINNNNNINNNINIHKTSLDPDHCRNLNMRDNVDNATNGKLGNAQGHKGDSRSNHTLQHCSHSASCTLERKVSSEKIGVAESCLRCSCVKTKNVSCDTVKLQEDTQVAIKECQKTDENKMKSAYRQVGYNSKRKMTNATNLSRKAKSFFRKKSRLATADSDCTLMLPGPRCIKSKQYRYEGTRDRLRAGQLSRRRNWINGMNSIRIKSHTLKRSRITRSRILANLRADNPSYQPSSIPLETQELLNKSYWEYYRKLSRKIALAEPDGGAREEDKRSNEPRSRANLPVSRTLQQCSVLSCVINNTLDTCGKAFRHPATVERSFSDPIANGLATRDNVCEAFDLSPVHVKRVKRKKSNHVSKRLLGLKAIVFLVVMVYVAIIFFPMMYDYLMLDEEHDYEDVSYIAFALEYVASSFEEAFDEIVDVVNTVFMRPVSFNREL